PVEIPKVRLNLRFCGNQTNYSVAPQLMIRRAIISDIHANLPALEAVLADIATQHVDEIVCLGDICGYGPQPVECIQRVRAVARWILLGNHDEAVYKEPADFSPNAHAAVVWQRTVLDPCV